MAEPSAISTLIDQMQGTGPVTDPNAPMASAPPPMPVAQPGAEAPIAPPQSSGRNLLAQLGISGSALNQLDAARSRSRQATDAGTAALTENQRRIDALSGDFGERPTPPTLQEVPAPPEAPKTDPLRVFGQTLPLLAMLGGLFVRNNATAALRAGAAAMQAARDNDAEALEQAHQQWTDSIQAITTNNATRLQQYQAIIQDRTLSMDERMAQLQALAASEQNVLRLQQLASGQVSELTEGVMLEMQANQQLTNAFMEQQRINAASAAPLNRPLRGPDAAQMTRIRETAEAQRGLRGLTQEFARELGDAASGQRTGPLSGNDFNPLSYLDSEIQTMRSLAARMTGLMRPTGSGATSDFEQRLYRLGAPSPEKPREVNERIIRMIDLGSRVADARQFFYEDFASATGGLNGAERAFLSSPEFMALRAEGDGLLDDDVGGAADADIIIDENGNRIVR